MVVCGFLRCVARNSLRYLARLARIQIRQFSTYKNAAGVLRLRRGLVTVYLLPQDVYHSAIFATPLRSPHQYIILLNRAKQDKTLHAKLAKSVGHTINHQQIKTNAFPGYFGSVLRKMQRCVDQAVNRRAQQYQAASSNLQPLSEMFSRKLPPS